MQTQDDLSTFSARFKWALERSPNNQTALASAIGASTLCWPFFCLKISAR